MDPIQDCAKSEKTSLISWFQDYLERLTPLDWSYGCRDFSITDQLISEIFALVDTIRHFTNNIDQVISGVFEIMATVRLSRGLNGHNLIIWFKEFLNWWTPLDCGEGWTGYTDQQQEDVFINMVQYLNIKR